MECFRIVNFLVKNSKMHRSLKPDRLANTDTLDQGFFRNQLLSIERKIEREKERERTRENSKQRL